MTEEDGPLRMPRITQESIRREKGLTFALLPERQRQGRPHHQS